MPRDKKIDTISEAASDVKRRRSIKEGLSEIYQDDDGAMIDVKKLTVKAGQSWQRRLVLIGVGVLFFVGVLYLIFYWLKGGANPTAVQFDIFGPRSFVAGETFDYVISYKNQDRATIKNIDIRLDYSENFIFSDSRPAPSDGQARWRLDRLAPGESGQIIVRGKIINEIGKANIITGEMYYSLENFSGEYKKVATFGAAVENSSLDIIIDQKASALVGEPQAIVVKYRFKENSQIDNVLLAVEPTDIALVEFINQDKSDAGATVVQPWLWTIKKIDNEEKSLTINFRFIDKAADQYQFLLKLSASMSDEVLPEKTETASGSLDLSDVRRDYILYRQTLIYEVVHNDLNLSLLLNDSDQDQGIGFGQTLNYTLRYANKGPRAISDVVIMATVEGDIIDWTSFTDQYGAQIKDKSATWTKKELPLLLSLAPGVSGSIDFSLKIKDFNSIKNKGFSHEIKSYATFAAQTANEAAVNKNEAADNKSNTIIGRLTSDVLFKESVVYFDDNNMPLGSGPIPLSVGQITVVRVGWRLYSTLYNLNDISVSLQLPEYVDWADRQKAGAGNIDYDPASRTIHWRLGRLTVGQTEALAEFDVAIRPRVEHRHQLLVIMPKATITATDSVTGNVLSKEGKIKTSKLEDDPLVSSGDLDNNGGLVK